MNGPQKSRPQYHLGGPTALFRCSSYCKHASLTVNSAPPTVNTPWDPLYTADFIKKVLSVYTHSITNIYLSLSAQVAKSTFLMKYPVVLGTIFWVWVMLWAKNKRDLKSVSQCPLNGHMSNKNIRKFESFQLRYLETLELGI